MTQIQLFVCIITHFSQIPHMEYYIQVSYQRMNSYINSILILWCQGQINGRAFTDLKLICCMLF